VAPAAAGGLGRRPQRGWQRVAAARVGSRSTGGAGPRLLDPKPAPAAAAGRRDPHAGLRAVRRARGVWRVGRGLGAVLGLGWLCAGRPCVTGRAPTRGMPPVVARAHVCVGLRALTRSVWISRWDAASRTWVPQRAGGITGALVPRIQVNSPRARRRVAWRRQRIYVCHAGVGSARDAPSCRLALGPALCRARTPKSTSHGALLTVG
jgi:hypothetical protein